MKKAGKNNRSITTLVDYHEDQHKLSRSKIECDIASENLEELKCPPTPGEAAKSENDVKNSQTYVTLSEARNQNFVPENYKNDIPELFF